MAWHYRNPLVFPTMYVNALRTAAKCPNQSVMITSAVEYNQISIYAEQFRRFKWCIKVKPEAAPDLLKILQNFDCRTKIVNDEMGYILYLTARPTKVSEFERLNPELAKSIGSMLGE